MALPALPLGDTTVLGLYDITDRKTCLLGSDRHITMDVVSVTAARQLGNGLALDLSGFAGLVSKYAIYAPDASGTIASKGGYASCTRFGDVYSVEVRFDADHMKVHLE